MTEALFWELAASCGAVLFTASTFGQWFKIKETGSVANLSVIQWLGYSVASLVFVMFYLQMGAYIMASVSTVGTVLNVAILIRVAQGNKPQQTV